MCGALNTLNLTSGKIGYWCLVNLQKDKKEGRNDFEESGLEGVFAVTEEKNFINSESIIPYILREKVVHKI